MVSIPDETAKYRDDGGEQSAPVLLELIGSIAFPAGRILVPGCGTGHDVLALAGPSNVVTGLDLGSGSVEPFEALRKAAGIPRAFVHRVAADPFTWAADGRFDAIWDAAWFATIEPRRRPAWAARVADLLAPGGALVMLIYPVGPIDPCELDALLGARFDRHELREVARSHPARRGREWLGRWRRH